MLTKITLKAKDFDAHLTRVKTLNSQLISRSDKLLVEIQNLLGKVQSNTTPLCTICLSEPIGVALNCGHLCCAACLTKVQSRSGRCPTCRSRIENPLKLYLG